MDGCEGWVFQGPEAVFCGRFWGGGEAGMGRFAAEFQGFWVAPGCGEAIQRTADMGGQPGRKNFLKKGWKTEKLGCERCRKVDWGHLI